MDGADLGEPLPLQHLRHQPKLGRGSSPIGEVLPIAATTPSRYSAALRLGPVGASFEHRDGATFRITLLFLGQLDIDAVAKHGSAHKDDSPVVEAPHALAANSQSFDTDVRFVHLVTLGPRSPSRIGRYCACP